MCANDQPNASAFMRNLRKPMPLPKKIGLVIRNETLKIVRLKPCCGHPGEPGC
jgi:hypothetical protein